MASGNPVVLQLQRMPPATSFATPAVINGASTPAERINVWNFADAAAAYLDILCVLKGYAGGGLTLKLFWAASVNTNNCVWQAAIRRVQDDAEDLDTTAQTYDYNTVTAAAPSAIGEISYDTITFTDGADMDSLADGEQFILRILRDPAHASDNLGGTAQLLGLIGYET